MGLETMSKSPGAADGGGGYATGSTAATEVSIRNLKDNISKFNGKLKLQHVQAGLFTLRAFDIAPEERPQCIEELSRKESLLRESIKQPGMSVDPSSPQSGAGRTNSD